jgi:hypothetical protein
MVSKVNFSRMAQKAWPLDSCGKGYVRSPLIQHTAVTHAFLKHDASQKNSPVNAKPKGSQIRVHSHPFKGTS